MNKCGWVDHNCNSVTSVCNTITSACSSLCWYLISRLQPLLQYKGTLNYSSKIKVVITSNGAVVSVARCTDLSVQIRIFDTIQN